MSHHALCLFAVVLCLACEYATGQQPVVNVAPSLVPGTAKTVEGGINKLTKTSMTVQKGMTREEEENLAREEAAHAATMTEEYRKVHSACEAAHAKAVETAKGLAASLQLGMADATKKMDALLSAQKKTAECLAKQQEAQKALDAAEKGQGSAATKDTSKTSSSSTSGQPSQEAVEAAKKGLTAATEALTEAQRLEKLAQTEVNKIQTKVANDKAALADAEREVRDAEANLQAATTALRNSQFLVQRVAINDANGLNNAGRADSAFAPALLPLSALVALVTCGLHL